MRYFLYFSYKGTAYHGSQTQPNGITVQQVLEEAIRTISRHSAALTFAGRTDAGVHAGQMVAHWDCEYMPYNMVGRLNNLLPPDIAVQAIVPVRDEAHARFDATARTYEYHVTEHKDPFRQEIATRVAPGLDYHAMNEAAELLLGRHDFASFCRVHTDVKTTYCTVTEARWYPCGKKDETGKATYDEAVFVITADRFLRNMVRAVVGTLFDIGRGKQTKEDLARIIAEHDRRSAGQSAPAEGLFLTHIEYPMAIFTR